MKRNGRQFGNNQHRKRPHQSFQYENFHEYFKSERFIFLFVLLNCTEIRRNHQDRMLFIIH